MKIRLFFLCMLAFFGCSISMNAQRTNWEKLLQDLNSSAKDNGREISVVLRRPGELAKKLTPDDCERLGYLRVTGGMNKNDLILLTELAKRKQTMNRQGKMVPARIDFDLLNAYIVDESASLFSVKEITVMPDIFRNCTGLRSVILPSNLVAVGKYAFYGCKNLEYVYIPDNVTAIENNAFEGATNLYNVDIPDGVEYIGSYAFSRCNELARFYMPSAIRQIGNSAFSYTSIKDVRLPEGLETIGSNAFASTHIEEIEIPSTVVEMDYTSLASNYLMNIYVNEANGKYSDIDGVLFNKDASILLYLPLKRTGTYSVPNQTQCIGPRAFAYSKVQEVLLPESCDRICEEAFYSSTITRMSLPNSITKIEKKTFEECSSLVEVELPQSLQSIDDEAFRGCKALEDISIPGTVTNIGKEAFRACFAFKQIEIPASVKNIGEKAFYYCKNADRIIMHSTVPPLTKKPSNYEKKVILTVPSESVAAYKRAAGWSDIRNIIAE